MNATIERIAAWFAARDDVRGIALVGSHARGDAGPGSDVDLVVLCDDPRAYTGDEAWPAQLGGELIRTRRWGDVVERRVRLPAPEPELDLGFVTAAWDPPEKLCKEAIWILELRTKDSGMP